LDKETKEWSEYQKGIDYKNKINLFSMVDKNNRMYNDDQWYGVKSNGLITPQFNIIKRIVQFKVSSILSNNVSINYFVEGIEDNPQDPDKQNKSLVAQNLSKYSKTTWERLKLDQSNERILKDGALSGDGISYFFWNENINTGQEVAGVKIMGDIDKEEIDNVNYIPSNPNSNNVQTQRYNILAFRKDIDDLKEEAKKNGMSEYDINLITSDTTTEHQAGDRAKIELDDPNKTICLLKLWRNKETGTIWAKKSTKSATIRKEWDTKLRRFPIALFNWEEIKNSTHGQADCTGIIPNQIVINKLLSLAILAVQLTCYPKVIYNSQFIKKWSNIIGEAIPVSNGGDLNNVAKYLTPGNLSMDVYKIIDDVIRITKDLSGASDPATGSVQNPDNASAIIAIQTASAIPLESVQRRFYQYIEDVALIFLDFYTTYYNVPRNLIIEEKGTKIPIEYNGNKFIDVAFRTKINVGPSSKFSEIAAIRTLDNLLQQDRITFTEYLERVPDLVIPDKQGLIEDRKSQDVDKIIIDQTISQFIQTLPDEIKQQLSQLDEQTMINEVKQMMVSQMGGGVQAGGEMIG